MPFTLEHAEDAEDGSAGGASGAPVHFLGLDAESGEPFYPCRPRLEALPTEDRGVRPGIAVEDLASAGWGVVFPRRIDPAIKKALAPLLKLRREQAGDRYRELTYLPREGPGLFRSRLRSGPGAVGGDDVPYYLLLVGAPGAGDPAAVPHGFEFDIGMQFAAGRLWLRSPEAYARYARAVVRHELRCVRGSRLGIFAPTHPGDGATETARRHLVAPVTGRLARAFPDRGPSLRLGATARKQALVEMLTDPSLGLLWTVGHGTLFRAGHERQIPCQGALVCADWEGKGPALSRTYLAASDLPRDADLGGKICVLFGCHTAGTPELDSYDRRRARHERARLAPEAFVARLPQALLGHPGGPALGVVAHVDRAFPDHPLGSHVDYQVQTFEDLLGEILRGSRLGVAASCFGLRHAELAVQIVSESSHVGDGDVDHLDAAELWRAYHDARSHVILGDPAVRAGLF